MKERKTLRIKVIIGFLVGVLVGCSAVFVFFNVGGYVVVPDSKEKTVDLIKKDFGSMPKIIDIIKQRSIYKFNAKLAGDLAYKAVVASLGDEYSEYMNKKETEEWESALSGEFSGVGINFRMNEVGAFEILKVIKDSPASGADIDTGDIIAAVDGKTFKTADKMAEAIRGEEGTKVRLSIVRDGKEKEITLVRRKVKEETVSAEILNGDTGYIHIFSFEEGTGKDFGAELHNLEKKGIKKMVIDLRNNGGGYTKEGMDIADMLLPEGTITYMQDKAGKKEYFNSDVKATKIKYVLLVNENTASTSEILTAAVKDNKGGMIVGTKTFGKGIVQETIKFSDGSSLKLTVMEYFSPKGKTIHKKGIKPDYLVELPEDAKEDLQLKKALEVLR